MMTMMMMTRRRRRMIGIKAIRWNWLIRSLTFIIQLGSGHMRDAVHHIHWLTSFMFTYMLCNFGVLKMPFRGPYSFMLFIQFWSPKVFPPPFLWTSQRRLRNYTFLSKSFQSPFGFCVIVLISGAEGHCRWVELQDRCCLMAPSLEFSLEGSKINDSQSLLCGADPDWPFDLMFFLCMICILFPMLPLMHLESERILYEKSCGKQFGFHVIYKTHGPIRSE